METKNTIFELSEISEEFKKFYYLELVNLGKQTGIGNNQYVPFEYDDVLDYIENNGYPELDNSIAENLKSYMKNVCGINVETDDIKNKWLRDTRGIIELIGVRAILPEWWNYIYSNEKKCKIYYIESRINEQRLGGLFVFTNPNYKYIVFQGITKFIIPTLAHALYPNCQVNKLNSLVQNSIEALAQANNATRIYVKPLPQDEILRKYYGFKYVDYRDKSEYYICDCIHKSNPSWMYKNNVIEENFKKS